MAQLVVTSHADGDGQVLKDNASWSTAHDAVTGDSANNTSGFGPFIEASQNTSVGGQYRIVRGFIPFDISALPNDGTIKITGGTVAVFMSAGNDGDNDGQDYIGLYSSTQASVSGLTTADFDAVGSTKLSDNTVELTSNTQATKTYTLNAAGIAHVQAAVATGAAMFSLREGHDAENSAISNNTTNNLQFLSSNSGSTSFWPKLTVDYERTTIAKSENITVTDTPNVIIETGQRVVFVQDNVSVSESVSVSSPYPTFRGAASVNDWSSTLTAPVSDSDTTISIADASLLSTTGVLVLEKGTAREEWIIYDSKSGNNLLNVHRGKAGSLAVAHDVGAAIQENMSVLHWDYINETLRRSFDAAGNIMAFEFPKENVIITTHLNASGASISGNFPLHPRWNIVHTPSSMTSNLLPTPMPQAGSFKSFAMQITKVSDDHIVVVEMFKNGTVSMGALGVGALGSTYASTASITNTHFNEGDHISVNLVTTENKPFELLVMGEA